MRISKGGLLVVLAVLVPILVELRTALSWLGVEISVQGTILVGLVLVVAIVTWAMWPPNGDPDTAERG